MISGKWEHQCSLRLLFWLNCGSALTAFPGTGVHGSSAAPNSSAGSGPNACRREAPLQTVMMYRGRRKHTSDGIKTDYGGRERKHYPTREKVNRTPSPLNIQMLLITAEKCIHVWSLPRNGLKGVSWGCGVQVSNDPNSNNRGENSSKSFESN